jgi:hypothetical protein
MSAVYHQPESSVQAVVSTSTATSPPRGKRPLLAPVSVPTVETALYASGGRGKGKGKAIEPEMWELNQEITDDVTDQDDEEDCEYTPYALNAPPLTVYRRARETTSDRSESAIIITTRYSLPHAQYSPIILTIPSARQTQEAEITASQSSI